MDCMHRFMEEMKWRREVDSNFRVADINMEGIYQREC